MCDDRKHEPECLAPRCPRCGSRDLRATAYPEWAICIDCIGVVKLLIPTDCICAEIAEDRALLDAEAWVDRNEQLREGL